MKENTNIVEKGTEIKGELKLTGNLIVLGRVEGNIESKECIILEGGSLSGDIRAKCIKLDGEIEGSIECLELFEAERGIIKGKVKAPQIIISELTTYKNLEDIIDLKDLKQKENK